MKNEPQRWREVELEGRKATAEIATLMLEAPAIRWLLRPFLRLTKWATRMCDSALKEDGWR